MSAASLRARYLGDAVATSSPQQVLVMLYDRLALDLERAQKAVGGGRPGGRERAAAARPGHRVRAAVQPAGGRLGGRAPAGRALQLADRASWCRPTSSWTPTASPPAARWSSRCVTRGGRPRPPWPAVRHDRAAPGRDERASVPLAPVNWAVVLDHLEGEVLAAEETLAAGRADEIAAWGRSRRRLGPAVEPRPPPRRPARARRAAAAAPAGRRRGAGRADHPVPAPARRRRPDVLRAAAPGAVLHRPRPLNPPGAPAPPCSPAVSAGGRPVCDMSRERAPLSAIVHGISPTRAPRAPLEAHRKHRQSHGPRSTF